MKPIPTHTLMFCAFETMQRFLGRHRFSAIVNVPMLVLNLHQAVLETALEEHSHAPTASASPLPVRIVRRIRGDEICPPPPQTLNKYRYLSLFAQPDSPRRRPKCTLSRLVWHIDQSLIPPDMKVAHLLGLWGQCDTYFNPLKKKY